MWALHLTAGVGFRVPVDNFLLLEFRGKGYGAGPWPRRGFRSSSTQAEGSESSLAIREEGLPAAGLHERDMPDTRTACQASLREASVPERRMENYTHRLPLKKKVYGTDQYVVENSGLTGQGKHKTGLCQGRSKKKSWEKNVKLCHALHSCKKPILILLSRLPSVWALLFSCFPLLSFFPSCSLALL